MVRAAWFVRPLTGLLLGACAPAHPFTSFADQSPESAFVHSFVWRYMSMEQALERTRLKRALGDEKIDFTKVKRDSDEFFGDKTLRDRLATIAANGPPKSSAKAMLVLFDHERLETDPTVARLNEGIEREMNANGWREPALSLANDFLSSRDAALRRAALAEMERRSETVQPLLLRRVQRWNEIAREAGAPDVSTFVGGARALDTLEHACTAQIARTADDWAMLLGVLQRRLGRALEFSDYAGATREWTERAGSFFRPGDMRGLAHGAIAAMGFNIKLAQVPSGPFDEKNVYVWDDPAADGPEAFGFPGAAVSFVQGHVRSPGFEPARDYFRAFGQAVAWLNRLLHPLPDSRIPEDLALREGVSEIFALIPRDAKWIEGRFPNVSARQREQLVQSARGHEALTIRLNCIQARMEEDLNLGRDVAERWPSVFEETFGVRPSTGPTWLSFRPHALTTPFYWRSRVLGLEVRDAFLRTLGLQPLVTEQAGRHLGRMLFWRQQTFTLDDYLAYPAYPTR